MDMPLLIRANDNAGFHYLQDNCRPGAPRKPHRNKAKEAAVVVLRNAMCAHVFCAKAA